MADAGTAFDPGVFGLIAGLLLALGLASAALRPGWIVGHPRGVLIALLLVCLLAASALFRLDPPGIDLAIDPSTQPLLPRGDPAQEIYRRAVLDFGDDEVFVIAVECEQVFSRGCLETIDGIGDRVARLPGVRSVTSIVDVTSFRWVDDEEWVEVRPFIDEIPADPDALEALRQRALADPVYRRTLVSEDARAAAINVSFRDMSDAEFIASGLDDAVAEILRDEAGDGLRFHVAGRAHVKVHVYRGMLRDLLLLIPLGVVTMALVLWILTGWRRGVFFPIATSLVSILWTFAAMAVTGRPLTLLTGLLAPMLLAIGSVYGVHVLARYQEEAATSQCAAEAALRTLEHLVLPVSIAGLTTTVGFAALLITDVPAVFELGAFSMLGVASITLVSLTGVPAGLALLPLRPAPATHTEMASGRRRSARLAWAIDLRLGAFLDSLGHGVARVSLPIIAFSLLLAMVAILALPNIVLDTDYLSYFDEDDPVRLEFEAVNRLLAGAVPIYVALDGAGPGRFRDPEVLEAMEALQRRIDGIPGVSRTLSSLDTMRVLNRAFHAGDPAHERIPDTRAGVTELLFMMPKAEFSQYATVNHGKANLIVRTGEVGSAAINRLSRAIEGALDEAALPAGVTGVVTGNTILVARSDDEIVRRQPWSVALAALAIFVLISLGLRSPGLGAIAMVPNLLPVLLYFGLLGLGVAPLSLPTSLIGCVALGIAIDDTVHYLVRYRAERGAGATPEEAVRRCAGRVGRPIVITSVMISTGFLVVAFSEFATLRQFGILSALTMALCLLTDLLLLPALLVRARI
ncbi:MAG: MMPL family transporter [Deltaproteobacteria bacterium]|nr:MMPL family transporter [Deltaproteobacteria bacterium]MBW2417513.1 MMPL family transporter [Deltaproteobacteria bacterium]